VIVSISNNHNANISRVTKFNYNNFTLISQIEIHYNNSNIIINYQHGCGYLIVGLG